MRPSAGAVTAPALLILALAALGLAPLGLVGGVPAASAHNQVTSTVPAAGEIVTAAPTGFSVTTNDAMLDLGDGGGFALDLVGPDGLHYSDGCVQVVDQTMTATGTLGLAGAYTMVYQLVSADGHTVSGEVPFTWAPDDSAAPGVGTPAARACGQAAPTSTPQPETSAPTDSSAPAPTDQANQGPSTPPASESSPVPLGDVLWIGGAVLAVLVVGGVTLLIVTRRRKSAD